MKKALSIFIIGVGAGLLDLIPLFLVQAPLFNMLSILAFWLCATFFIYKTKLFTNGAGNGFAIAVILMLPMALAVSASNSKDFFPMMLMAILLGPIVGLLLHKFTK